MILYCQGLFIYIIFGMMDTVCSLNADRNTPVINTPSDRMKVQIGRKMLLLECHVQGSMPLNISWIKSGKQIINDHKHSIELKSTEKGISTNQLWINEITHDSFGYYTCTASNYYGKDEKNVTVEQDTVIVQTDSHSNSGESTRIFYTSANMSVILFCLLFCFVRTLN